MVDRHKIIETVAGGVGIAVILGIASIAANPTVRAGVVHVLGGATQGDLENLSVDLRSPARVVIKNDRITIGHDKNGSFINAVCEKGTMAISGSCSWISKKPPLNLHSFGTRYQPDGVSWSFCSYAGDIQEGDVEAEATCIDSSKVQVK